MSATKKLMMGSGLALDVVSLFATSLYAGNSTSQTISNGINLAGEGGLVWIKPRTQAASHSLFDTDRGAGKSFSTSGASAETDAPTSLTEFTTNGFALGDFPSVNASTFGNYVAWTFRKSHRFFDVVTYTGNGVSGRKIPHNLGVAPGLVIVKNLGSSSAPPHVQHRSLDASTYTITMNSTNAATAGGSTWVEPAGAEDFTVGAGGVTNSNGARYVAYLFAHDPEGVIQCGAYTGNGSAIGPIVDLGWQPQYILVKNGRGVGNWYMFDTVRGIARGLWANSTNTEVSGSYLELTATGFRINTNTAEINSNNGTYIYMAIRAPE